MKVLRNITIFSICLILIVGGGVYYAFKIEPYRIKLNEYTLNEEQAAYDNSLKVKIVQISDVHIKEDFTYEDLGAYIKEINAQKPDIVLFTGDLYDNYAKYNDNANVSSELQKIEAKYAKIAIWGNRDYGGGAVRQYAEVMEGAGFTLLTNENWYITLENGKNILFTGLDDSMMGNPIMPDATKIYNAEYEILLTHEPDAVQAYMEYPYDLILSGHSHGGQVDIPFLPFINDRAVAATSFSTTYTEGMYTLDEASGKILYVNTGVGTTHISARFGVIPEIALFYIYM